ncbi:MAG TPA: hypothetical protein VGJ26_13970 [Pirellulales bacterium]|jgi:hypothetical protein
MRFVPLLAAAEEWIKVIVPLVMFTVYALNKLFGGDAAKKKMQQQRPPRPAPPAPPKPTGERQRVEDEVAEFLRRATQSKEPRPGPPPAPPKQPRKGPAEPAPVRRLAPKRDESAPLYDNDPPETRRPAVAPKVREKSSSSGKRIEAPRPTDIDLVDEAMEAQIHQALDHKVGSLAGTAPTATSDQKPVEDENRSPSVADLLRNPQSIRDAIVVSEILRRPTERW